AGCYAQPASGRESRRPLGYFQNAGQGYGHGSQYSGRHRPAARGNRADALGAGYHRGGARRRRETDREPCCMMVQKIHDITAEEAAEKIAALSAEIGKHNLLYHGQDAPEISDAEFDALFHELQALEAAFPELIKEDSPTQRVGAAPEGSGFAKVKHQMPMLSLSNVFSDEELADFLTRVRRFLNLPENETIEIFAEPKI